MQKTFSKKILFTDIFVIIYSFFIYLDLFILCIYSAGNEAFSPCPDFDKKKVVACRCFCAVVSSPLLERKDQLDAGNLNSRRQDLRGLILKRTNKIHLWQEIPQQVGFYASTNVSWETFRQITI